MNRAPEETINRKSPSKHARTGMVWAVPATGGTGTQRGPVRCPYGLHTVKRAGHVPRPHRAPYSASTVARMGPVPFCPYRSRTVLPLPVPYSLAHTGPVPFCSHGALTTAYQPLPPPYRPRTVFPVPPYRCARTFPVPFAPMLPRYQARTRLYAFDTNHTCQCHFCLYLIITNHTCQCNFCLYLILTNHTCQFNFCV